MKIKNLLCIIFAVTLCCILVSCGGQAEPRDLWENAVYTEDTELGTGEKTVTVEVVAEEKAVTFKINTDKSTLGDALSEHKLISGEQGAYGLYVKVVNGITAEYNTTKSYWSLNKDGEYMTTGVDDTEIADGDSYQLLYTNVE